MDTSFAAETYDTLRAIPFPTLHCSPSVRQKNQKSWPSFFLGDDK
jgi:hypothetical protein